VLPELNVHVWVPPASVLQLVGVVEHTITPASGPLTPAKPQSLGRSVQRTNPSLLLLQPAACKNPLQLYCPSGVGTHPGGIAIGPFELPEDVNIMFFKRG